MFTHVHRILPASIFFALLFASGYAQTGKPEDLENKFRNYQLSAFHEKLFLHVDKTCFLAGEVIWFKIYDVDGYLNHPLDISALCYVEILSANHQAVLQTKIDMKAGEGSGSIIIPASVASGNYVIRAYTAWMKNFSADYFYEQDISIINTLNDSSYSAPAVTRNFDIQFFPEGGNLVYGISSKVAFRSVNQYGEGISCKGIVVNQKHDTVARFEPAHLGMGNFIFTPAQGEQYTAYISVADTVIAKKLPSVYDQGYVMSVVNQTADKIKITVHTNIRAANPAVYLLAHTRELVKNAQINYINNGDAVFYLDRNELGEGISHITVFNAEKNPVCERLYFKQPPNRMHVDAKSDQPAYSTRSKINLDVHTTDPSGQPLKANLSMSVFLLDSFQTVPQENILNYLLMGSDLRGKIASPQYYFENSNPDVERDADNLMLTQGWSRFRWEDIIENKKPVLNFLPETEGLVVSGKITDRRTGLPAPAITAYLTLPDTAFELGTATSRANGDIHFAMKKYFGNHEIIVQTNYHTDSNFRVDIQSPFSDRFSENTSSPFNIPENWKSQLQNRSINAQVENTYQLNRKNRLFLNQDPDSTSFYGKPDLQYNLDDYTRFVTIEEVMREYVAAVRVRKEGGKFYYRVRNDLFNTFFEDAPLLLIDGVPIFDADKIMAFDPLKIKRIDVVSRKYYMGSLITDGIISYKTYEGDLSGYQLDPNAVVLQYNGLQQQREFFTPVYENKTQVESRVPDLRNVLMWSPEIKTDEQGKSQLSFYTSDVSGRFALLIQGITAEGLPGSNVVYFTVSANK